MATIRASVDPGTEGSLETIQTDVVKTSGGDWFKNNFLTADT